MGVGKEGILGVQSQRPLMREINDDVAIEQKTLHDRADDVDGLVQLRARRGAGG